MNNVKKTVIMVWIYFAIASVVFYIATKDVLPTYLLVLIIGILLLNTLFLTRILKKREVKDKGAL